MTGTATGSTGAGGSEPVVRPVAGTKGAVLQFGLANVGVVFGLLRVFAPILRFKQIVLLTRFDDVREALLMDEAFGVPYARKLDVIMGGKPFFLGMNDTPEYRRDTAAMHKVVRFEDIAERLAPAAEAAAEHAVATANGRIEVVGELVRKVTFDVLLDYFGTPAPQTGDLMVWATRLFEFQFADGGDDPDLAREVAIFAPALRTYVQSLIDARRSSGEQRDDVLGRCLEMQGRNVDGFSDDQIRCALIGFIVGGLPQPPMVGPQALEQLLRRPRVLAVAQDVARRGEDSMLTSYVFEAMRFDPLGPFLTRTALKSYTLAAGTARARKIEPGTTVLVSFESAMMDGRRVSTPSTFDPDRPPCNYIHFGQGLHQCFGIHINRALLPLILKPLLKREALARAPDPEGRLRKQGIFADRLVVCFR
jgi:cytochrome P450